MINLTVINLYRNNLSGNIPPERGNLENLKYLYLDCSSAYLFDDEPELLPCLLSGSIPSEIENLTNLEILALGYSNLSGSIPSWIGKFTKLYGLNLERNMLSGSIPVQIKNLVRLEWLILSRNNITGTIPVEIGDMNNLRIFNDSMIVAEGKAEVFQFSDPKVVEKLCCESKKRGLVLCIRSALC